MNPMEAFLGGGDKGGKDHLVEDEASSTKSGKIYFNKPAGFKMPDGVKDGESFDAMASMKFENGKLCLHEIDGTPVEDEPEEGSDAEESPETPEEESMEDESAEPAAEAASEEEPEGEEPADFLDAIEKKSARSDKETEDKKKKGNPFAK